MRSVPGQGYAFPGERWGRKEGEVPYRGGAPIFVTSKLSDLQGLATKAAIDPSTGQPRHVEASMLYRRLKVYPFTVLVKKPPAQIPYCGSCSAQLVLGGGVVASTAPSSSASTAGTGAPTSSGGVWV